MGGVVNGGFNSKKKSWQKKKKEKERQVKKRKGTAATHVAVAIKGVSGKRTKKSQRKAVHVGRLAGKQQAALESEMQIETAPATKLAGGKKARRKQLLKQQKQKAAPAAADAAAEAMQE